MSSCDWMSGVQMSHFQKRQTGCRVHWQLPHLPPDLRNWEVGVAHTPVLVQEERLAPAVVL